MNRNASAARRWLRLFGLSALCLIASDRWVAACPLVTEYADSWLNTGEEAELPVPVYGYGSVETCGTELPVDMQVDMKDPNFSIMDVENVNGAYGFGDAYLEGELTSDSVAGEYITNVQAWLGEEHFACYNALIGPNITMTHYQNPTYYPPATCVYATTACSSGVPSCTSGGGLKFGPYFFSCSPYAKVQWLKVTFNGYYSCLMGLVWHASGPGPCS